MSGVLRRVIDDRCSTTSRSRLLGADSPASTTTTELLAALRNRIN